MCHNLLRVGIGTCQYLPGVFNSESSNMRVAYERVSTAGQSTLRQDVMMQNQNIEKVFTEKISGKNRNRPELEKMLDFVREGGTVVIESISRLARSTRDFLNIPDELEKKNVALVSLKEQIDTATPTGRFLVSVFAALAQLEREQILTRQKEGIAAQKAKGIYTGGRPRIKIDQHAFRAVVCRWRAKELTAVQAAKELSLTKSTFYRLVKQYAEKMDALIS